MPSGARLAERSGASQGVRVTIFASAAEVTRRERQVWLLIAGLALAGTAAAAGLAVLQARRFIRPLQRLTVTSARLGDGDFSARTGRLAPPEFDAWRPPWTVRRRGSPSWWAASASSPRTCRISCAPR